MPSVDSSTSAEPQEENPEMMCPHLRKLAAKKESSKEEKTAAKSPAEDKPEIKGETFEFKFFEERMILGHGAELEQRRSDSRKFIDFLTFTKNIVLAHDLY